MTLPSILDDEGWDLSGVYARQGFAYQDSVAALFLVRMLADESLLEVACETLDDITLVQRITGEIVAEFVQVKAEHPEQLWSTAMLCEQKKASAAGKSTNTSLFEKSLSRDRVTERARFRIVTCRQIHSDLSLLTFVLTHPHRQFSHVPFKELHKTIVEKCPAAKSAKDNGADYWLQNVTWEVHDEKDIEKIACAELLQALHGMGVEADHDLVVQVYGNLRALAKQAAESGIADMQRKRISRTDLRQYVLGWVDPHPGEGRGKRLGRKMTEAGLDGVAISAAREHQAFYLKKKRTPSYLSTLPLEELDMQVLSRLHDLRTQLDAGVITDDGPTFHHRCLAQVDGLQAQLGIKDAAALAPYLVGCMYEITARCRHRFTKAIS